MTFNDTSEIVKKAEDLVTNIFATGGEKSQTVQIIMNKLYVLGDELVEKTEINENVINKIDCKVGCCFCCYTQVTLTPAEALHIGEFIKENYSLKQTDSLMKRISNTLKMAKGKSDDELDRYWAKTPCVFLDNDKCSIYNVRPFLCRAWHSLSVDQCRRAFESGNNEAEIDSTPFRGAILGALRNGLRHICELKGWESQSTDLISAIKTILSHPDPCVEWFSGKKIFRS